MPVRTVIEHRTKDKRSVAFSLDWQGWSRGAKSAEVALETLESYRERYRPIADLAGMAGEFDAAGPLEVVEERVGTGSTDFWGISFSPSSTERDDPMGEAEFERGVTLLRASWAFFDGVAARVSPAMRLGPRGGAPRPEPDRPPHHPHRERGLREAGRGCGSRRPALTPDGLRQHREAYVAAMRAYNAGEVTRRMRSWTLPFLIRHSAFHTLDHRGRSKTRTSRARTGPERTTFRSVGPWWGSGIRSTGQQAHRLQISSASVVRHVRERPVARQPTRHAAVERLVEGGVGRGDP